MDWHEIREAEFQEGLKRWLELTKDWSDEDRKWAWDFIAGASQPFG